MKTFDYIIIGGGPTGITLAKELIGKNVLLIDKNESLGGCHRVDRIQNRFTEHGPRVYSSAFINFKKFLRDLNIKFTDLFVEYNFQLSNITYNGVRLLSYSTILKLTLEYFKYLTFGTSALGISKQLTVREYCILNNIDTSSITYLDRLCRLTDGCDSSRYPLVKLLDLVDQSFFYKLYQPRYSNDKVLFDLIKSYLLKNNINISLNTELIKVYHRNKIIKTNNGSYRYNNLVLCIPPNKLNEILDFPVNNLGNVIKTSMYNKYIPITFHWDYPINIEHQIHGFPVNDWGIIFLFITDYNKSEHGTILSCSISIVDKESSKLNKTANECNEIELIKETFRQVNEIFDNKLPMYNKSLVHNKNDTAFINTNKGSLDSNLGYSIYSIGTHNNKNEKYYNFTTIESAIINALSFLNKDIQRVFKLSDFIYLLIVLIVLSILFLYLKKI